MTELSTINCSYFSACSGCEIQKNTTHPPVWDEIKEYFHSKQLTPSLNHLEITGWRTRAKLAVRGVSLFPDIGLFKKGTHDVVDIPNCPLHHPSINVAIAILKEEIKKQKLEPYDEKRRNGVLRYLQFVVERKTNKVQLTLVVNAESIDLQLQKFINALKAYDMWHSLWVNFQPGSTNRILSDSWEHCYGERYLWEELNKTEVCFHPACFAQAHLPLFNKMLISLHDMLLPNKKVVEYYAGVGVIGLSLLSKSKQVICSEISPFSKECFSQSKERLVPEYKERIAFHVGKTQDLLYFMDDAEVVVVDPPRKGLDPGLLKAILSSQAEQILYVSCGFRSFVDDCERLIEGGWIIEKAEGYILFPGTNHVEIVASLRKKSL